jgi:hypothetical protein
MSLYNAVACFCDSMMRLYDSMGGRYDSNLSLYISKLSVYWVRYFRVSLFRSMWSL